MTIKKTILIILDGWGHGDNTKSDCVYNANTSFIDSLYNRYPHSTLRTDGEYVGLPKGQMGNSEVGHLNIGAGRIVNQELLRINKSCENGTIASIPNLHKTFAYVQNNKKKLHLIGLLSDGGIHSHERHLYKLCELANTQGLQEVFIHAFTDGRDTDPKSGAGHIKNLEANLYGAKIASVCGRYYAMDRDQRWERIKIAYDLLVKGIGKQSTNLLESINESYLEGVTDEFIKPIIHCSGNGTPISIIEEGDAVICFNFRTDRCRQITSVLTQNNMQYFGMKKLNLHYTTMTNYDETFKDINVIYPKEKINNTLGEVIDKNHLSQIRIAETEKYPHVTFFFSGGKEEKFLLERRILVDSPKVATYDLKPEMNAKEVTLKTILEVEKESADFICLNYANADMVGHTGNYNAIIKALETVDRCAQKVVESAIENNYAVLVIADHGNAEYAINKDGTPNTAHTTNLVPCFLINTDFNYIEDGKLGDIAPTILKIMGLNIPKEMTGNTLIK